MNFLNLKKIQENTFEGSDLWSPFPGYPIFGGQLSAQSLCAGISSIDFQYSPSIVHTMFLNPGDPQFPIKYTVQVLKSGKTLQMLNIIGEQKDKLVVHTTVCCTLKDDNLRDFESIHFIEDILFIPINEYILKSLSSANVPSEKYNLLVENLGVLNESFDIQIGEFVNNKRQIKITILKKDISKNDFYLFLTLVSDLLIVESALLSLNLNVFSKELYKISSVDHNLYFVGTELPKTNTIFYILECINIKECKAIIEGKMCTEEGILVCVTTQQALVRFK